MIAESGKFIIFMIGLLLGYLMKDRPAKAYLIKEFSGIRRKE